VAAKRFHTFIKIFPSMKKAILFFFCSLLFSSTIFSQQKEHKIVFDFTRNDTASFSVMIRHVKNIMNLSSNSKYEIVCHGAGLDLLIKDKTTVEKDIRELSENYNVVFTACEMTMKRRGVDKTQLVANATTVPAATLEISSKQQEGWSYIKE
jgi:uncharacterized protein